MVKNVCLNNKFCYGYKSLSKLLSSYIKNNNLGSNIVIKSAPLIDVDWARGNSAVNDSLVELHCDTSLNEEHGNDDLENEDKESSCNSNINFLEEMAITQFSP